MRRRGPRDISCFCLPPMASGLSPAVRPGPIKQKTALWRNLMSRRITRRGVNAGIGATLLSPALARSAFAQGAASIKIGFGMALTGPLAVNGQQALLGSQIWEEEINAKGGLLGRQGQAIPYDGHSNL